MKWLAALLLLLPACAPLRVPPHVQTPPARYKATVSAILKVDSPTAIAVQCMNTEALMCAKGDFIFAPYPWLYPDDPYAIALWHELAHVMGWRADHPD